MEVLYLLCTSLADNSRGRGADRYMVIASNTVSSCANPNPHPLMSSRYPIIIPMCVKHSWGVEGHCSMRRVDDQKNTCDRKTTQARRICSRRISTRLDRRRASNDAGWGLHDANQLAGKRRYRCSECLGLCFQILVVIYHPLEC